MWYVKLLSIFGVLAVLFQAGANETPSETTGPLHEAPTHSEDIVPPQDTDEQAADEKISGLNSDPKMEILPPPPSSFGLEEAALNSILSLLKRRVEEKGYFPTYINHLNHPQDEKERKGFQLHSAYVESDILSDAKTIPSAAYPTRNIVTDDFSRKLIESIREQTDIIGMNYLMFDKNFFPSTKENTKKDTKKISHLERWSFIAPSIILCSTSDATLKSLLPSIQSQLTNMEFLIHTNPRFRKSLLMHLNRTQLSTTQEIIDFFSFSEERIEGLKSLNLEDEKQNQLRDAFIPLLENFHFIKKTILFHFDCNPAVHQEILNIVWLSPLLPLLDNPQDPEAAANNKGEAGSQASPYAFVSYSRNLRELDEFSNSSFSKNPDANTEISSFLFFKPANGAKALEEEKNSITGEIIYYLDQLYQLSKKENHADEV